MRRVEAHRREEEAKAAAKSTAPLPVAVARPPDSGKVGSRKKKAKKPKTKKPKSGKLADLR